MKYLVTKTIVTEHYWENDEMAEKQCSRMRGVVSFAPVKGHIEAVDNICHTRGCNYSGTQVEYILRRYNEEMFKCTS